MTDKELHKLGRRELLQLMLAQGREAEKAKQELAEVQDKLQQLEESYERLKRRLDDKDTQIHKLRTALQSAQGGAIKADGAGTAVAAVPVPDDYYAPPPPVQQQPAAPVPRAAPSTAPPTVPPVQQSVRAVPQPQARHGDVGYTDGHVAGEASATGRHTRREQEYYDYLFGPVQNQGHQAQQPKRERPRPQAPPPAYRQPQAYREPAPPYREPQHFREQPPMPAGQWSQPQYMKEQPHAYYNEPQYRYAAYAREQQPPVPVVPEPSYPSYSAYSPQSPDEFIPAPEVPPENSMQMLNAVEIVDGRPVSQSQVLRPKR